MNSQVDTNNPDPAHTLLPMIFGALQGKALTLMAELNIAEYLSKEPMDIEVLATATGTDPVALDRYLCLLTHLGLVSETDDGLYKCTQLGALLQKNKPSSLHDYARLTNSDIVLEMIRHMDKALVSGESVFTSIYGESFYNALQNKPKESAIFDGAMREISGQDIPEILDSYDFDPFVKVVDVGGGQGHLLDALLNQYSQLQGTLVELPEVSAGARSVLDKHINNNQCQIVSGDFLQPMTTEGDLYILKRVLSHCSDDDAMKLLSNIRANIKTGGSLLVIDPDTESLYGASFNLLMLVVVGGKGVRSEKELQSLFTSAGFKYERNIRLQTELCIIEAIAI